MMSSNFRTAILILALIVICLIAYVGLIWWQEDRLIARATQVHKGMRTDEVIDIMGKPKYIGLIDSSQIPTGVDPAWTADLEGVTRRYVKLLFYNYYIKQYKFPTFKERLGTVQIDICFDPVEQKVVYVSRFYAMD
jgi:hypothetical protein